MLSSRSELPGRRFLAVEPQRQALRAAAGFDEFVERRVRGVEAAARRCARASVRQPVLVTTVRPTTTALQAKRRASSSLTGDQLVDTASASARRP